MRKKDLLHALAHRSCHILADWEKVNRQYIDNINRLNQSMCLVYQEIQQLVLGNKKKK